MATTFTKKQYYAIAKILGKAMRAAPSSSFVDKHFLHATFGQCFIEAFEADNPAFDRARFWDAIDTAKQSAPPKPRRPRAKAPNLTAEPPRPRRRTIRSPK